MAYPPGTTPTTREDVDTVLVYTHDIAGHPVPRQWFNRLEACAYLGVSPRTLLRLRKEGRLTGYAPEAGYGSDPAGGKLRYRRADLDALLELKPAPHPDAPSEPDQDPIPGLDSMMNTVAQIEDQADTDRNREHYVSVHAGDGGPVIATAPVQPDGTATFRIPDDVRTELGTNLFAQPESARIRPLVSFGGAHFLLTDREMADYLHDEAEDATWD